MLTEAQLARYARHVLLREVGVRGQERLLDAHVALLAGPGADSAVAYLAAAGVGRLTLVGAADALATLEARARALNSDPVVSWGADADGAPLVGALAWPPEPGPIGGAWAAGARVVIGLASGEGLVGAWVRADEGRWPAPPGAEPPDGAAEAVAGAWLASELLLVALGLGERAWGTAVRFDAAGRSSMAWRVQSR